METEVTSMVKEKKMLEALKEQLKTELKNELQGELKAEIANSLQAQYLVQREETLEIIRSQLELLCEEIDPTMKRKVDSCFAKLIEMYAVDADEALKIIDKWKLENQNFYAKNAVEVLCDQMTEREKRSKDRWMTDLQKLRHYFVHTDGERSRFQVIDELLNRFRNYLVIVFMKVTDEVEDLCCSVSRKERDQMADYLLPGLTRKNAISTVMGDNVRFTFARNDQALEFHAKAGEPVVIINYDFYSRTRTYLHRLRLAGLSGEKRGIVINLVDDNECEFLPNLEYHYDISMESLPEVVGNLFATEESETLDRKKSQ